MYLCIDVGNTQIHAGIFDKDNNLLTQFRHNTAQVGSSDQFGLFLLEVIKAHNIDAKILKKIIVASVVPSIDYSLGSACVKYLGLTPLFLGAGVKTGIKIGSNNAGQIGADLIAGAVGGIKNYPNKHLFIFDFGTATTVIYVNNKSEFMGGAILPGLRLMVESLHSNTAKLSNVNILAPEKAISKDTTSAIQAGIYYSQVGAAKELITRVQKEYNIPTSELVILGTGGFAGLLNQDKIFDDIIPELVLIGLKQILDMNN